MKYLQYGKSGNILRPLRDKCRRASPSRYKQLANGQFLGDCENEIRLSGWSSDADGGIANEE
jgi:hypothetical protein